MAARRLGGHDDDWEFEIARAEEEIAERRRRHRRHRHRRSLSP